MSWFLQDQALRTRSPKLSIYLRKWELSRQIFLWIWVLVNKTNNNNKTPNKTTPQPGTIVQMHKRTKSLRGFTCNLQAIQLKPEEELPAFFPQAWQIIPYFSQIKPGHTFPYSTAGLLRSCLNNSVLNLHASQMACSEWLTCLQVSVCTLDGAQETLFSFHFKRKHKMVLEEVMLLLMLHFHH